MAVIKIDRDKCTGCGICSEGCNNEVLQLQKIGRRKKSVAVHPENCSYCLNCMDNCDYDAIEIWTPEGHLAAEVMSVLREKEHQP